MQIQNNLTEIYHTQYNPHKSRKPSISEMICIVGSYKPISWTGMHLLINTWQYSYERLATYFQVNTVHCTNFSLYCKFNPIEKANSHNTKYITAKL